MRAVVGQYHRTRTFDKVNLTETLNAIITPQVDAHAHSIIYLMDELPLSPHGNGSL